MIRTRTIRKAAKAEGKTFDDIAAEREAQGIPFEFAERKSRKEWKAEEETTSPDPELGPSRSDKVETQ